MKDSRLHNGVIQSSNAALLVVLVVFINSSNSNVNSAVFNPLAIAAAEGRRFGSFL